MSRRPWGGESYDQQWDSRDARHPSDYPPPREGGYDYDRARGGGGGGGETRRYREVEQYDEYDYDRKRQRPLLDAPTRIPSEPMRGGWTQQQQGNVPPNRDQHNQHSQQHSQHNDMRRTTGALPPRPPNMGGAQVRGPPSNAPVTGPLPGGGGGVAPASAGGPSLADLKTMVRRLTAANQEKENQLKSLKEKTKSNEAAVASAGEIRQREVNKKATELNKKIEGIEEAHKKTLESMTKAHTALQIENAKLQTQIKVSQTKEKEFLAKERRETQHTEKLKEQMQDLRMQLQTAQKAASSASHGPSGSAFAGDDRRRAPRDARDMRDTRDGRAPDPRDVPARDRGEEGRYNDRYDDHPPRPRYPEYDRPGYNSYEPHPSDVSDNYSYDREAGGQRRDEPPRDYYERGYY